LAIDLSGVRAKIERAHDHRIDLQGITTPLSLGDGAETEFIRLSAKLDTESGYHDFRIAAIPEAWRPRIGAVLGDVVHNLRSALDYLFFELCCHYLGAVKTERLGGQVQFPIEDMNQRLANKRGHFQDIPSAQWSVIEAAQPYHAPEPASVALRALRELSNRDKHRVLNPLLLRSTMIQFYDQVQATRANNFEWPDEGPHALGSQYLEVGTEVVRVALPEGVDSEVEVAGHIAPTVQLPDWDVKVSFGVGEMTKTVEGLVDGIEALI
jgi:hypothetical protein